MIVVLGGLADVERDHPGVSKLIGETKKLAAPPAAPEREPGGCDRSPEGAQPIRLRVAPARGPTDVDRAGRLLDQCGREDAIDMRCGSSRRARPGEYFPDGDTVPERTREST